MAKEALKSLSLTEKHHKKHHHDGHLKKASPEDIAVKAL
jgi:hypothetical protein